MKVNKRLLAVAVAGALVLPTIASAASLQYVDDTQIFFAKDLIVNNGTTIYTPDQLVLSATSGNDAANVNAIIAGEELRVKVTLTNGARFDATAPAGDLVDAFIEGDQTGGAGPVTTVGTPYYSASGQELNFVYTATGAGSSAGDDFLTLNSMQITNLVQGLFDSNTVGAEITVQNQAGTQILAAKQEIAKSKWGLAVTSVANSGDLAKTIDSASCEDGERKTLFSPTGAIQGSCSGAADTLYFNAGAFELDIAQAPKTGGTGDGYVNNFSAAAMTPEYNIVGTSDIFVAVNGVDLTAFDDGKAFLSTTPTCDIVDSIEGELDGDSRLVFEGDASSALWANVTNASPGASVAYVCVIADGETQMEPQALAGDVEVDYNLDTQRVTPPVMPFTLLPLRQNGVDLVFQNVNPAGNSTAQSFLRLTNNNASECPVSIVAKDDAGLLSDSVSLTLAPHASMQLNSEHLENGGKEGTTGAFGNGTGKWYVRVSAECTNFKASALNRHHDGVVTDLTAEKTQGLIEWLTPSAKL